MTDRHIMSRNRGDTGTGHGAIEFPWGERGAFSALDNTRNTSTGFNLPALDIGGADHPASSRTGHIIQLPGGGTKDLRLADEPQGNRQRLSDSEYTAKLREVDAIDAKLGKPHRTNRSKDV